MVVIAEYVWIDSDNELRSKSMVLHNTEKVNIEDLPEWNFDGSSTNQASGDDSEVILKPVRVFSDPFRKNGHILVLCSCYKPSGEPIQSNTRENASHIFNLTVNEVPWFGIEQEYTLFKDGVPLGWTKSTARSFGGPTVQMGFPGPQGPYYCSAGADVAFGRDIAEEHLQACIYAGIQVSGINAEVMPGQWEYQVGPCVGIDSGDQLWMSRYLLNRVCEKHGIVCSYDPKPIPGDWNGAGCHTNVSTKKMREENGFEDFIIPAMEKLSLNHKKHIKVYGEGNEARLTGEHETANIDTFKWGVADRGASIRVGNKTKHDGKGYFEDRRPASNMDPYVVTSTIIETICL